MKCVLFVMLFVLWFSSTYLTCMPVRKSTSSSTTALTSADTSRPVSPFALPINFNDAASFIFRRDVKGFQEFILLQTSTLSVAQLRDQDSGITLLHLAAERNQSEIVAFLFTAQVGLSEEVKQDLVNAKDRRGWTPLAVACFFGHAKTAGNLLILGADWTTTVSTITGSTTHLTMLHLAVGSGDFDTAALLIGFIKVNDYTHNLPLHHFVNAKDGNGLTALHRAILSPPKKGAEEKDAKIIQLLVENGSQLDEQTYDMGWTALHFACRMGDEAAVEALVSSGANSSIKDVRERTALDIAVEYGHPSFIFLIPTTAFDQDHYGMFFIGMEGEAAPSITTSNQFDINQDIIDLYSSTVGDEEEGEREKSAVARGGMKRKAGRPRITAKKSRPRSDAFDITTRPTKKSRKEEEEE